MALPNPPSIAVSPEAAQSAGCAALATVNQNYTDGTNWWQTYTFTATEAQGWHFEKFTWDLIEKNQDGTIISSETGITATSNPSSGMSEQRERYVLTDDNPIQSAELRIYNLTAHFVQGTPTTYTITTAVSPSGAGTTTGDGTYTSGATATITATANRGFRFSHWELNGVTVSTSATYSFVVSGDATYTAVFDLGVTISATVYGRGFGTVSINGGTPGRTGSGMFFPGDIVTLDAFPEDQEWDYFDHWILGSDWEHAPAIPGAGAHYQITVTTSAHYGAVMGVYPFFTVRATAQTSDGGTVSIDGGTAGADVRKAIKLSASSCSVSLSASPTGSTPRYRFVRWAYGSPTGATVSTSPDFVYTPDNPQDGDIFRFYAIYEEFNSVTTKATPAQGGYIRPIPGTPYYYQIGSTVRVTATPREHWKFVKWIDKYGTTLGTDDIYEFIMPAYSPVYIEGIFEWDGTDLLVNSSTAENPAKLVYDDRPGGSGLLVADY